MPENIKWDAVFQSIVDTWLSFIDGLVAPNQGLFPKYDAGLYTDGSTSMVVSRGIGNSIIPFRFNNRPEIVLAELNTR